MSAGTSFAIINGQKLHAVSGRPLDSVQPRQTAPAVKSSPDSASARPVAEPAKPAPTRARSIDGLAGPVRASSAKPAKAAVAQSKPTPPAQPVAITQPAKQPKPAQPKQHPTAIQTRSLTDRRSQRASQYQQHHAISKFGNTKHQDRGVAKPIEPTELAPRFAPSDELAANSIARQLYTPTHTINQHLRQTDLNSQAQADDNQPSKKSFMDRLRSSPKTLRLVSAGLSVLVLGAYVAYLNAPALSLRVAANRAGINAELPGYTPSGFSLNGPIEYSTGKVVLNFSANADDRGFSIVEEKSPWNSESLRENSVANQTNDYQTVNERGLTIYIYNGSNATWVNQGIKYTLTGDSLLNEDQITKIATSL